MLFHFNSEKQFAACSAVSIGALSFTWLGLILLDIGNIFCFLKSKALIKLHCQTLSLDDPFPPSLHPPNTPQLFHSGESTFFKEELSSLKEAFLPLFYQMKVQGRSFGGYVSKAGKPAACSQGVMLLEASDCRKILPLPGFSHLF